MKTFTELSDVESTQIVGGEVTASSSAANDLSYFVGWAVGAAVALFGSFSNSDAVKFAEGLPAGARL